MFTFRNDSDRSHARRNNSRHLQCEQLEDRRMLAVVTVDTHLDTVDFTDGVTSLREAIFATNLVGGADTIEFDAALTNQTILLTMGELHITDALTVNGLGQDLLTIDASGNDPTPGVNNGDGSRVFNIDDGNNLSNFHVEIRGLTLTGGDSLGQGGAIFSLENLSIADSAIANNSSNSFGGGIFDSFGTATITGSTVSGNSTIADGGGIWAGADETTITDSTITDNSSGFWGGGIRVTSDETTIMDNSILNNSAYAGGGISFASDRATITGNTITGNSARFGGGIFATTHRATITESTISMNSAASDGGGIYILTGTTIISASTISGNSSRSGGGIYARPGVMAIYNSTISDNSASRNGGGIRGSTVTITGSTISNNSAHDGHGGGISGSITTITDSTISDNSASRNGGGISAGKATIGSSTISGNAAGRSGGGISASNSATITGSTIAGNSANLDGIFFRGSSGGGVIVRNGTLSVDHTIVAGNHDNLRIAPDVTGTVNASFSLIGDKTGSGLTEAPIGAPDANGNLIGGPIHGIIDPLLGPLADNGGPTLTHALLPGSPAIDAGDPALVAGVGATPGFDQRDEPFTRVFGTAIDMGAFEAQSLIVDTLVDESDGDFSHGDFSLREAIELANQIAGANTIEFDPQLAGGTILLTMGELVIIDALTINGLGQELLTIDASGNDPTPDVNNGDGSRIFNIDDGNFSNNIDVEILGLTLTGGDSLRQGGAIFSLENLSIADSAIANNSSNSFGGGIFNSFGTTRIKDSTISGNSAGSDGGGIRNFKGNLVISSTTISDNLADDGGGIYSLGLTAISDSIISRNSANFNGGGIFALGSTIGNTTSIVSSTISSNTVGGSGGGIFLQSVSTTLAGSTISGNTTLGASTFSNGAGIIVLSGTVDINDSLFADNTAADRAGGARFFNSNVTIERTTFRNNESLEDWGGAIHSSASEVAITDSTFHDNRAYGRGGAIHSERFSGQDGLMTITNSTISGNSADRGGGISNHNNGELVIRHSTITGNQADIHGNSFGYGFPSGGGVYSDNGTVLLDHTIVAGNFRNNPVTTLDDIGGQGTSVFTADFSLIQAVAPGTALLANNTLIGFDPMLGPLADNGGPTLTHALLPGSPAIDAGDPTLVAGVGDTPEFDQRGAPFTRVAGLRIDLGAFESQPLAGALNADFNGSGNVDGFDFLAWQRNVGMTTGALIANGDATGDGDVDGNDMAVWEATYNATLFSTAVASAQAPLATEQSLTAQLVDLALAVKTENHTPANRNRLTANLMPTIFAEELPATKEWHNAARTVAPHTPSERIIQDQSESTTTDFEEELLSEEAIDELFATLV